MGKHRMPRKATGKLEDLGLTHPLWQGSDRVVSVEEVADAIMQMIDTEFSEDSQFVHPRQSAEDDIVITFSADHYVRITLHDEDTDPVNGPAPEPFSEDNFVEAGPPGDTPHGSPRHVFHDEFCPDDRDTPPDVVVVNPHEVEVGDLVLKIEDHSDWGFQADYRYTVRRGAKLAEPPF